MGLRHVLVGIAILFLLALVFYPWEKKEHHAHADFRVVFDGQRITFTDEKYMTGGSFLLHKFVHLHDHDGDVIHVHKKGITLGDFFISLNFKLNSTCIVTDTNIPYCASDENKLQMFVNGKENIQFDRYEPQDLDRILIIYGGGSDIQKEISLVTDKACIQSGQCPGRGDPYNESMTCGPGSFCVE
ncbi:hypothetical protein J4419_05645 [Candidatus Woesearchaeota archaeon]|nr:hypothetical protein [Candidatus Woesearchaeota archaeon]